MLPTAQNAEHRRPGVGLDASDKVTSCFDFTTLLLWILWQVVTAACKQTGVSDHSDAVEREHEDAKPMASSNGLRSILFLLPSFPTLQYFMERVSLLC